MSKKTYNTRDIIFKFKCLQCNKEVMININEILEVGNPICCDDEEMKIDDECIKRFEK